MNVLSGFLLALLSALAFGLYVLPRRESRLGPEVYLFYMAIGFLIPSTLLMVFLHAVLREPIPAGPSAWDVVWSGLIWAFANLAYILAIDAAGVARATAVKNLTGLFGTLAGIVLLGELLHAASIVMTLIGSVAVALSAILLGQLSAPKPEPVAEPSAGAAVPTAETTKDATASAAPGSAAGMRTAPLPAPTAGSRRLMIGMLLALLSAVGLGVYLVPGLQAMDRGLTTEMYVGSFAFAAGVASILIAILWALASGSSARLRVSWTEARLPGLSGLLWICGSAAVTPATQLTGLAIAWPVSQLGFFLTLAYAIVRLREVDWAQGKRRILVASGLTLIGLVLLGVARQGA